MEKTHPTLHASVKVENKKKRTVCHTNTLDLIVRVYMLHCSPGNIVVLQLSAIEFVDCA